MKYLLLFLPFLFIGCASYECRPYHPVWSIGVTPSYVHGIYFPKHYHYYASVDCHGHYVQWGEALCSQCGHPLH